MLEAKYLCIRINKYIPLSQLTELHLCFLTFSPALFFSLVTYLHFLKYPAFGFRH